MDATTSDWTSPLPPRTRLTQAAGVRLIPAAPPAAAGAVTAQAPAGPAVALDAVAARLLDHTDGTTPLSELAEEAADLGMTRAQLLEVAGRLAAAGVLVDVASLPRRPLPDARLACVQCERKVTNCCHLTVGPLTDADVVAVEALDWASMGLTAPADWLVDRGARGRFLRRAPDGPCCFLDGDGLCKIHKHFGEAYKPLPCRLYPVVPVRVGGELRVGLDYGCPGIAAGEAGQGDPLATELAHLGPLVAVFIKDEPADPSPDPDGALAAAVAGAAGPDGAARALAAAAAAALPEGTWGLTDFAAALAEVTETFGKGAPPWLHRQMGWLAAGLRHVAAGTLPPGAPPRGPLPPGEVPPGEVPPGDGSDLASAEAIARYERGFVVNQVFVAQTLVHAGVALGVTEVLVALRLGRWLAGEHARTQARPAPNLAAAAFGLSSIMAAIRTLRLLRRTEGAGARLVREAADLLG